MGTTSPQSSENNSDTKQCDTPLFTTLVDDVDDIELGNQSLLLVDISKEEEKNEMLKNVEETHGITKHQILITVSSAGIAITIGLVADLAIRGKDSVLYQAYIIITTIDAEEAKHDTAVTTKETAKATDETITKKGNPISETPQDTAVADEEAAIATSNAIQNAANSVSKKIKDTVS